MGKERKAEESQAVGGTPLCKNLARILGYPGYYVHGSDFSKNLDKIHAATGISQINIRQWMAGSREPRTKSSLRKLAHYLGIDVYELFVDHAKYIDLTHLMPEQQIVLRLVEQVTNLDILNAIKSMARAGITTERSE